MNAQERYQAIAVHIEAAAPLIAEAYRERDWEQLGYDSWSAYRESFGAFRLPAEPRKVLVGELRSEGLSQRAIADVVGVDQRTVRRDISGEANASPEVVGLDGKKYKATRPHIVTHPAKYSDSLYDVFREFLPTKGTVLDPFAGVGGIHQLATEQLETVGIELEPEWADAHPQTRVGDATALPFDDDSFDAICTSPTYGNRMADTYQGDATPRYSYTIALGRPLSDRNTGSLQWGDAYRGIHERAWDEAVRVLRPGGMFLLNCKDHIRDGARQKVTGWHLSQLQTRGLLIVDVVPVPVRSLKHGANASARTDIEWVAAFTNREAF